MADRGQATVVRAAGDTREACLYPMRRKLNEERRTVIALLQILCCCRASAELWRTLNQTKARDPVLHVSPKMSHDHVGRGALALSAERDMAQRLCARPKLG